jgi:hypothetical protein
MTDTNIDIHNPIFEALHKIYTRQQYLYFPHILSSLPLPHTTTVQYKYGSKYTINTQTSTTPKDNTITRVEETKNKQGQVSKKHQTYLIPEI